MHGRRQFIKIILGFLSGVGLAFSPIAKGAEVVFARVKKIILPKGTRMSTLVNKNPADLDTRNLDLTPVERFGTMGLDDYQVNLNTCAYHAHWRGVSVAKLLEKAQMITGVTHVSFSGPEGTYEKTE